VTDIEEETPALDQIAVIGMAGRFPMAPNLEAFWERLSTGTECIRRLTDEELAGVSEWERNHPDYIPAGAFLDGPERFDAAFFDMIPREAQLTDPQQRIFFEICWEALERAGYDPERCGERTGIFAGSGTELYLRQLLNDPELMRDMDPMSLTVANMKDHLAPRTSYLFNLRGPSVPVQTACSTSLVAVHLACQSLITYQSDMVLAGGVCVSVPHVKGYIHVKDSILSPDGHCRTFDAQAAGTVAGNGAGVVLLKRLEDALEDGDHIHAVIRGSAVNNDGSLKLGYTAPSVDGQTAVIEEAMSVAAIAPEEITYVEAHGTGTALGDPVELTALSRAWSTEERGYCAIGSVKTNIGHLDTASGIAGLIKTILCLEHKTLVPSLHYENPNPRVDMEASPFFVNTETRAWEAEQRVAAVSSFGIGGTNAHVILTEAPEPEPREPVTQPVALLTLSAKTRSALSRRHEDLVTWLEAHPEAAPADITFTLNTGRKAMAFRRAFPFADREDLIAKLRDGGEVDKLAGERPGVVFLFPGQGTPYEDLGAELYGSVAVFAETIDQCSEILEPMLDLRLVDYLFTAADSVEGKRLRQPDLWQPALFTLEYALAQTWLSWGVEPEAVMGHSVGEYVAAVIAGVLALEAGLDLIARRGRGTAALEGGAMLAVVFDEASLTPMIEEPLSLAAVNGPKLCVVSGPTDAIDDLAEKLKQEKIRTKRLSATHAFHSSMMEPLMGELTAFSREHPMSPPEIPLVSNVTGDWLGDEDCDEGYWARHLRGTVRFEAGAELLMNQPGRVFLEVGPGKVLTNLIRNHDANEKGVFPTVSLGARMDRRALDAALASLWRAGVAIDWDGYYGDEPHRRLELPAYPFERESFWYNTERVAESARPAAAPRVDLDSRAEPTDWLYLPTWVQDQRTPVSVSSLVAEDPLWLLFLDGDGLLASLADQLEAAGGRVIRVTEGDGFTEDPIFTVDPIPTRDYIHLIDVLAKRDLVPDRVVYGFARGGEPEEAVARGLDNPVQLIRKLAEVGGDKTIRLDTVTREMERVTGTETGDPRQALVLGPVLCAPRELPGIRCRAIDLQAGPVSPRVMGTLITELADEGGAQQVCLRGRNRWVPSVQKMAPATETGPSFREGGVVLLINGWRDIAMTLAQTLVLEHEASVVIADRAFFPADEASQNAWIEEEGAEDPVSERIEWVRALEALGAEIRVHTIDPGDATRMAAVVASTRETLGPIDTAIVFDHPGAMNTIAESDAGYVTTETREALRELAGLAAVREEIARIVLFTSNPAEGLAGMVRQRAAEAVIARTADAWSAEGQSVTAIEWGTRAWRVPEQVLTDAISAYLADIRDRFGMSQTECVAALGESLAFDQPRVIVSTRDYPALWAAALAFSLADLAPAPEHQTPTGGLGRPELETPYLAPRNALEEALVEIWISFFGYDRIGVHDNFFELGGHSLMATRVISRLRESFGVELSVETLFASPTIDGLAVLIEEAEKTGGGIELPPITAVTADHEGNIPLSFAQQRLWFLDNFLDNDQARAAYNIMIPYGIDGDLSALLLEQAFGDVVRRQGSLRTVFRLDEENQPYQVVVPFDTYSLPVIDLSGLDKETREATAREILNSQRMIPFDLEVGPPYGFYLVQLEARSYDLIATVHHTVGDGWSIGVIIGEVSANYRAFTHARPSPLAELEVQYTDYTLWQRSWENGPYMHAHLDYWMRQLDGIPPLLDLPTDAPRTTTPSFAGDQLFFDIPAETARAIEGMTRKTGTTLFMALQTILTTLFSRYAGQDDVVLGSPIANRNYKETEPLVGFFVNTLVLRTDLSGDPTALELLDRVRKVALDAFSHQDVPFEYVVEKLQPERNLTQSPLFQIMFALQNTPTEAEVNPGLTMRPLIQDTVSSIFDMTWNFYERGAAGMTVSVDFNTDLYTRATVERMGRHYNRLARAMAAEPERPISTLDLLPEDERNRVLDEWNQTETEQPRPVGQRIAGQADTRGEAIAIRAHLEDGSIEEVDYRTLNEQVRCIAHGLRANGIGIEDRVAVLAERTPALVATLLGINAAGAAFLPLDPAYPADRLAFMIADSGAAAVITVGLGEPPTLEDETIHLRAEDLLAGDGGDQPPDHEPHPDQAAYIIYTSGSTGRPKGTVLPHRGFANSVENFVTPFETGPDSRWLQFAALGFDAVILEIFPILCAGGRLTLAPRDRLLPGVGLDQLLLGDEITHVILPPSALALVGAELPALTCLIVAGEAPTADLVARFAPGRRFINAYGPTEDSVCASFSDCDGSERIPPIGAPVNGNRLYVVDRGLRPRPIGVPGELLLGGVGLARGYLNRPAKTAEVFIPDPFGKQPGARLYRTGDLVRYREEDRCVLEFNGRIDHQVKLRGFRIELAEIESALSESPAVSQAVVIMKPDMPTGPGLVAFVIPVDEADAGDLGGMLLAALAARLPAFMLPSHVITLREFPLTPNKKVDRHALAQRPLPAPGQESAAAYREPESELQVELAAMWRDLLKVEKVGLDDNFFQLGGHSLLVTRLVMQIQERHGIDLDLKRLFTVRTLEELAVYVEDVRTAAALQRTGTDEDDEDREEMEI